MLTIEDLAERFWQFRLRASPELCTYLGFDGNTRDLDAYTEQRYKTRREFCETMLTDMEQCDSGSLDLKDQVTWRILKYNLEICLSGLEYKAYLMPVNHIEGVDRTFRYHTSSNTSIVTDEDFHLYCHKLSLLPRQIQEKMELLKRGIQEGVVHHEVVITKLLAYLRSTVSSRPEDLQHYQPFKTESTRLSAPIRDSCENVGIEMVKKHVQDPLVQTINFLEKTYLPSVRTNPSVMSLPGGSKRYAMYIKYFCDVDWTPQAIHNLGKTEITQLLERVKQVMKKTGFHGTNVREFYEFVQQKEEHFFTTPEEAVEYNRSLVMDTIRPRIAQLFWKLPRKEVKFQVATGGGRPSVAVYYGASRDGARPARIIIAISNPRELPKYEALTLMLHEGEPGHHLQHCVMNGQDDLPLFRRYKDDRIMFEAPGCFTLNTAYTEGWGLYAEQLGDEIGIYSDPYNEYGYCCQNLGRAARLVVDTGIHAFGWTREEAINYMSNVLSMSHERLTSEVDRYITWPAQACAYKIGQQKINELRRKAKTELGSAFDIRDFHDEVLTCGQVPLDILTDIINRYIERKKTCA